MFHKNKTCITYNVACQLLHNYQLKIVSYVPFQAIEERKIINIGFYEDRKPENLMILSFRNDDLLKLGKIGGILNAREENLYHHPIELRALTTLTVDKKSSENVAALWS